MYFLLLDEQIVYVGKGWNVGMRVRQHFNNRMPFTHAAGLIVPRRLCDAVETFYIRLYEPPLNVQPGRDLAMWDWANAADH